MWRRLPISHCTRCHPIGNAFPMHVPIRAVRFLYCISDALSSASAHPNRAVAPSRANRRAELWRGCGRQQAGAAVKGVPRSRRRAPKRHRAGLEQGGGGDSVRVHLGPPVCRCEVARCLATTNRGGRGAERGPRRRVGVHGARHSRRRQHAAGSAAEACAADNGITEGRHRLVRMHGTRRVGRLGDQRTVIAENHSLGALPLLATEDRVVVVLPQETPWAGGHRRQIEFTRRATLALGRRRHRVGPRQHGRRRA